MSIRPLLRSAGVLGALGLLAACASDSATGPTGPQDVTINFSAAVGSQAFVCGQSYANLGTAQSTASATDFMLYVSDVRLLTANGGEVPVTLTQGTSWQLDNVALIDFATGGTGSACPNATPEVNTRVVGTVPAGTYTGLRFQLGLPFEKNHIDQTTATGPLSLSRMFWSWNGGYKAVRLDLNTPGFANGWFIHLGSTGCTPTGSASTVPTSCAQPNRITLTFPVFDLSRDVVVADVAQLLSGSDLTINQGGPAGCMSGTTDLDCPSIFSSFGLPFNGGSVPASQSFFRVARP
ncbi:MAG TPA: metallo-mystery pair system four-Cys motif protein [Gemmatimonadaceae bacterium]|nr:metallo-mystery pair system four-Cys motif protein [Gemmatimonadaceae bacterium]